MSTTQAAEHFGVHIKTILRWIRDGKLSADRVDGRWHVQVKESDVPHKEHDIPHDEQGHDEKARLERADVERKHLMESLEEKECNLQRALKQLDRRDETIESLTGTLESLTREIDHLTQLLALKEKHVAVVTSQLETSREMIEDMRQRKPSVWKRIFRWT
ncbi:excisionase family DNA-binding protein [Candidatus Poribacteria bacterium]|nr:excisionase family DNA-binding protein [Candidatus Poribacteria bacterium]MBI3336866.1 excisionase family DNA-binding protein [Candidatus Peregrinibacteria bacterium]